MPLMCLVCLEIYKDALDYFSTICIPPPLLPIDENGWFQCPKVGCAGNVAQVDELILPTIRELTKKHYWTKACCSAHHTENCPNAYILFREDIVLPSIPKGWNVERTSTLGYGIAIRKGFDPEDPAYSKNIIESNLVLLEWSQSIEDYYSFSKSENFATMEEQLSKLELGQEYTWTPD